MSETRDSDINPYAPPKSWLPTYQESHRARPTSTKWLLAILWAMAAFILYEIAELFLNDEGGGLSPVRVSIFFVIFGIIQFRKRSIEAFVGGCVVTGTLFAYMVLNSINTFRTITEVGSSAFSDAEGRGELIALVLLPCLFGWLFYRFIFGLPSRQYYRITPESA